MHKTGDNYRTSISLRERHAEWIKTQKITALEESSYFRLSDWVQRQIDKEIFADRQARGEIYFEDL